MTSNIITYIGPYVKVYTSKNKSIQLSSNRLQPIDVGKNTYIVIPSSSIVSLSYEDRFLNVDEYKNCSKLSSLEEMMNFSMEYARELGKLQEEHQSKYVNVGWGVVTYEL